jgi:DNA-binding transcriptional LysR family regulator
MTHEIRQSGVPSMIEPGSLQGILGFVHAVEAGSFTRAAERLRLTKSAVGKAVAQMEQRLGVRLLNRTTRSLSLTSEGEAYYEACVRALSELEAAQALLAARRQVPSGRLRVDLPLSFGRRCVAPVLFGLAGRYPDLDLEISFNDRRIDLVQEGIDLVVRMGALDDSPGLAARKLAVQRSALCAAPAYLEKHGFPRTVAELAQHELVVYGRDGVIAPWLLNDGGRVRNFKPRGRIVLGHGDPILDAVRAGCGISYLPTWLMADDLRRGALRLVLSHGLVENLPVHALWPLARNLAPRIRVAVDALVAHFSAPEWDRT